MITMADPPNQTGALMVCDLAEVMTMLSGGRVDLGFIGGAQVDVFGNVNTHQVTGGKGLVRLPGSGGGADIACLAHRLLIIMPHEKRRLVPRVDFITSPGWSDGARDRAAMGLPRGGPQALITTLGVFEFPGGRATLAKLHPGVDLEQVRRETGWELAVAPELASSPEPSGQQLEIIRRYDPERFWTG